MFEKILPKRCTGTVEKEPTSMALLSTGVKSSFGLNASQLCAFINHNLNR